MPQEPTPATVKRLFAESGNRCPYPGCQHRLVDEDGAIYAEICHITARNAGGPRFDASLTEEERRSFDNLLLLCRIHHVRIDGPATSHLYSVATLRRLKSEQRGRASSGPPFDATNDQIRCVATAYVTYETSSVGQVGGQTAGTIINHWQSVPADQRPEPETFCDTVRAGFNELVEAIDGERSLQTVLARAFRIATELADPYWEQLFSMHLQGDITLMEVPDAADRDAAAMARLRAEYDASWDRAVEPIRNPSEDFPGFLAKVANTKFCISRPPEISRDLAAFETAGATSAAAVLRLVEKRIWRRVNSFVAHVQSFLNPRRTGVRRSDSGADAGARKA